MYKINVSELVHQDLERIVSYIAINLASLIKLDNEYTETEKIEILKGLETELAKIGGALVKRSLHLLYVKGIFPLFFVH